MQLDNLQSTLDCQLGQYLVSKAIYGVHVAPFLSGHFGLELEIIQAGFQGKPLIYKIILPKL